jgi:hypothetical protein
MSERAYEVSTVDRLVAVLNGGDDGAEATRQYREIMDRLANNIQEHGGTHKAKLTLTIEFKADAKGLDVAMQSKATLPARPVIKERFFMSEKNTLTLQDPARDSMFPGSDLGRSPRTLGGAS